MQPIDEAPQRTDRPVSEEDRAAYGVHAECVVYDDPCGEMTCHVGGPCAVCGEFSDRREDFFCPSCGGFCPECLKAVEVWSRQCLRCDSEWGEAHRWTMTVIYAVDDVAADNVRSGHTEVQVDSSNCLVAGPVCWDCREFVNSAGPFCQSEERDGYPGDTSTGPLSPGWKRVRWIA